MPQSDGAEVSDPAEHKKARRRAAMIVAGILTVAAVAVAGSLVVRSDGAKNRQSNLASRRADVERRGAAVMPFDQNKTMHRFTQSASGGVETITSNDPNDTKQVALIQEHLTRERDLFAAGNFSDPMAIHGMAMPGIEDLQRGAAAGRITIGYAAMVNGARLTYASTDPTLIDALHVWFDAQLMDHGSHAMG